MSEEATAQDYVWAAVLTVHATRFDIPDIERRIRKDHGPEAVPNERVTERVLRTATELGVLWHRPEARYWEKRESIGERWPRRS
ncbi:MAG: hypothetical protein ABEH56_02885 [Salinirussus sp.]